MIDDKILNDRRNQFLTACSCHVTYIFQSKSTLYSCLNVMELLAQSMRESWSLSGCNWTRTHNHLIQKRALNHLTSLALPVWLNTEPVWLNGWVLVYQLSGCGFESSYSHLNQSLFNTIFQSQNYFFYCATSLLNFHRSCCTFFALVMLALHCSCACVARV